MAIELAKLQAWLEEAENGRHRLMMGEREVTLSHALVGTNAVTYQAVDADKLDAYITRLEERIARAKGRGRRGFWIS